MKVAHYEKLRRDRPDLRLPAWDRTMTPEQRRFAMSMTRSEIVAARVYRILTRTDPDDRWAFVPSGCDL